jgi:hypothetical protein
VRGNTGMKAGIEVSCRRLFYSYCITLRGEGPESSRARGGMRSRRAMLIVRR